MNTSLPAINALLRPYKLPESLYAACHYFLPRILFLQSTHGAQVQWGDVAQALHDFPADCTDMASARFWDEWMVRWARLGDEHLTLADLSTSEQGRARCLRAAAGAYHWAEFMYFSDRARKTQLREQVSQCFKQSLQGSGLNVQSGAMSWHGHRIPYYLIMPDGAQARSERPPCVILSNGLDSVTEVEPFAFAEQFVSRGIAALLFEGPGQGVHVGQSPLETRSELLVADLVTHLRGLQCVDTRRVGFFGVSFGGYLALRVARYLGRDFKGVVNLSGGPRLAPFAGLPRRLKEDFQFAFMEDDAQAMQQRFDDMAQPFEDLSAQPCQTDVLSIHGELDDIFPVQGIRELHTAWGARHHQRIYPRAAHVCLNHIGSYSVELTDWLATRLLPDRTPAHRMPPVQLPLEPAMA